MTERAASYGGRVEAGPGADRGWRVHARLRLDQSRAGASGFLLKDAMPADLVAGIRTVAAGDAAVASGVTRRLIEAFAHHLPTAGGRSPVDERLDQLTGREREVLIELARARSNSEIAHRLRITEATVKVHVSRILAKLDLHDRAHVVVFAYENGIVERGTG